MSEPSLWMDGKRLALLSPSPVMGMRDGTTAHADARKAHEVARVPSRLPNTREGDSERKSGMTVTLANGGKVTVLENGTVEFREKGRVFRTDGRGDYAENVRWIQGLAYGTEVRYVTSR